MVRQACPPSLERHWHPQSKAHLPPEECFPNKVSQLTNFLRGHKSPSIIPSMNNLWKNRSFQTFCGATMLALLGVEFSLCRDRKLFNEGHLTHWNSNCCLKVLIKTWRGGWGPITDWDRVDWGPMKSRTWSQRPGKKKPQQQHWWKDWSLQTDCAASALPFPLLSALLSCSLDPPRELRPVCSSVYKSKCI